MILRVPAVVALGGHLSHAGFGFCQFSGVVADGGENRVSGVKSVMAVLSGLGRFHLTQLLVGVERVAADFLIIMLDDEEAVNQCAQHDGRDDPEGHAGSHVVVRQNLSHLVVEGTQRSRR